MKKYNYYFLIVWPGSALPGQPKALIKISMRCDDMSLGTLLRLGLILIFWALAGTSWLMVFCSV